MKKSGLLAFLVSLLLVAGSVGPATAAYRHTWTDPTGDVHTQDTSVSARVRNSIDLKRVRFADHATSTRIVIKVARLIRTRNFVQGFQVSMHNSTQGVSVGIWMYAQRPRAGSIYYQYGPGANDYRTCNRVRPTVKWAKNKILIDVPHRCTPRIRGKFHVQSHTAPGPNTDGAAAYSWDNLRFRGRFRS